MKNLPPGRMCFRFLCDYGALIRIAAALGAALVTGMLAGPQTLGQQTMGQGIQVRHVQGTSHGFLLLHDMHGKSLAWGESIQIVHGDRVISRLVFHFYDGSIDDDMTVFTQRGHLKLLSDRHLQKGPQFLHPMNVSIDATTGQVRVRTIPHGTDAGKGKVETYHVDIPPDLSNGLVDTILINLASNAPEVKVSYLAAMPKPRIVHFAISRDGADTFLVGGARHQAVRYVLKTEIGGVDGVVAPLIGKQPKDVRIWVVEGIAPAFVRMEGPLFDGGPVWEIEQSSPTWANQ